MNEQTNASVSNLSSFVNELFSIITSKRNRFEKNRSSDVKRSQLISKFRMISQIIKNKKQNSPQSLVKITSIDMIVLHPSRNRSHGFECCCIQTNERSSNL
jgi:hypothetical protein